MKRRGTLRFAVALAVPGFALAFLFTVVYDGARAVRGLAGQYRREARALR